MPVLYSPLVGVGKFGLIRLVWDQEIAGSNPVTRTQPGMAM